MMSDNHSAIDRKRRKANERKRRYRARLHKEKYGEGAGDQRGKHSNHVHSEQHYRWNFDSIQSSHGYTKIRVGISHPLADSNGYAYEHHVVWVSAGNAMPTEGEVIHHINENKGDNRIENLKLMLAVNHIAYHSRKYWAERKSNPQVSNDD